MHIYIYVCVCVCVYVYICTYTFTYTYTHLLLEHTCAHLHLEHNNKINLNLTEALLCRSSCLPAKQIRTLGCASQQKKRQFLETALRAVLINN